MAINVTQAFSFCLVVLSYLRNQNEFNEAHGEMRISHSCKCIVTVGPYNSFVSRKSNDYTSYKDNSPSIVHGNWSSD